MLKDWKKTTKNMFVRTNNVNKMIHIFENKLHSPSLWYVDVSDSPHYEVKDFKSKSLALAFAKSYMRSH